MSDHFLSFLCSNHFCVKKSVTCSVGVFPFGFDAVACLTQSGLSIIWERTIGGKIIWNQFRLAALFRRLLLSAVSSRNISAYYKKYLSSNAQILIIVLLFPKPSIYVHCTFHTQNTVQKQTIYQERRNEILMLFLQNLTCSLRILEVFYFT